MEKLLKMFAMLRAPKGDEGGDEGGGGDPAPAEGKKGASMTEQLKKYRSAPNKSELEEDPAELVDEDAGGDEEEARDPDADLAASMPEDGDPAPDDSKKSNKRKKVEAAAAEDDEDESNSGDVDDADDDEDEDEDPVIEPPAPPARASSEEPATDPDDELAEMLFKDPKAAIKKIRADVRADLQSESRAERAERKFWKDFYATNRDLSDFKDIVNDVVNKNVVEIQKLKDPTKIAEFVKSKSREHIDNLRRRFGNGSVEKLPKGGEKTLGASGARAPKTDRKEEPLNFAKQVRKFQRRSS